MSIVDSWAKRRVVIEPRMLLKGIVAGADHGSFLRGLQKYVLSIRWCLLKPIGIIKSPSIHSNSIWKAFKFKMKFCSAFFAKIYRYYFAAATRFNIVFCWFTIDDPILFSEKSRLHHSYRARGTLAEMTIAYRHIVR